MFLTPFLTMLSQHQFKAMFVCWAHAYKDSLSCPRHEQRITPVDFSINFPNPTSSKETSKRAQGRQRRTQETSFDKEEELQIPPDFEISCLILENIKQIYRSCEASTKSFEKLKKMMEDCIYEGDERPASPGRLERRTKFRDDVATSKAKKEQMEEVQKCWQKKRSWPPLDSPR